MLFSRMSRASVLLNFERHSSFVKVLTFKNCKVSAGLPCIEVNPHPEITTGTPPPTSSVSSTAGAMVGVVITFCEVSNNDMSKAGCSKMFER